MTKRSLPAISASTLPQGLRTDIPASVLARWQPGVRAAATGDSKTATISIYDVIGSDGWGGGFTDAKCAAILRNLGGADVTVDINSPGGSMFDGIAIYNQLREYSGHVSVRVMGLAASAASVIAMAGDSVQIGVASFLMIHNCFVIATGNANDLRSIADTIAPFDAAMADLYTARTGIATKKIAAMMDAETWIRGKDAVDQGFADSLLSSDTTTSQSGGASATSQLGPVRALDIALAKAGMPRSERRRLINELRGTQDAAETGTQDAADNVAALAAALQLRAASFGVRIST